MDKVTLNDDEILEEVKKAIGITGEYQNAPLMIYISEVKEYLAGSGVEAEYIDSNKACGGNREYVNAVALPSHIPEL